MEGTYSTLAFRIRRHLVNDDLQQIVVGSLSDGEVLARSLLKLCIEDVRVALEDGDDLVADLGEEVEPFEVGREEEGLGRRRAQVGARVQDLELLDG